MLVVVVPGRLALAAVVAVVTPVVVVACGSESGGGATLPPIITISGLQVGFLLGGAVFTVIGARARVRCAR